MAKQKVLTESGFDELDAELGREDIGFTPRSVNVKINHQSAAFEIPGIGSDDDLEVVVLAAARIRTFFPKMGTQATTDELSQFTGGRPLCSSSDYANGELVDLDWVNAPDPAGMLKGKIAEGGLVCSQCPLNKWESVVLLGRTGRGKACDDRRRLLLWMEGWTVPVILGVSPSSIRNWDNYCSSLAIARPPKKPHHCITKMSLESVSVPGIKYAVIKFKYKSDITEEMKAALLTPVDLRGEEQSLIKALVDIFRNRAIAEDEYSTNSSSSTAKTDADDLGDDF